MARDFIPQQLEDLTPSWLTQALRTRGLIGTAQVASVRHEVLGDGEGFMGIVARLFLDYDAPEVHAPQSLIAKLPTAVVENRAMGELLGAYEREIYFYNEFSVQIPTRVPAAYYTALDRDRTSEHQEQIVAFVDRLPPTLIRASMKFARWVAQKKQRRYLLLLEDLHGARPGDQVAGASATDCRETLRAIGRTHAAFWESPKLRAPFWLSRVASQSRSRLLMYRDSQPQFAERFDHLLRQGFARVTDWIGEHAHELAQRLHGGAPQTLIHGDLRLDNVFFDEEKPDDPVVLIDWQLAGCGAGAYDVAYLLGGSLDAASGRDVEEDLLRTYHETLVEYGVKDYDYAEFRRDYERALLTVLQTIASTDTMDLGEDRGASLIDLWVERLFVRTRELELDRLR